MSGDLESFVNRPVSVITADGRIFIGTLKGFDQTINLILDETHERVYSTSQGVEQVVLGLHIVRGDNICVVGEIDEDLDQRLDLANIKADPINPIPHSVVQ
ncbi:U6 snRNA-associated Sm-like protein LSm8 [Eurytemora carolleeae]|uniref:U6 snRNA-associated Sm-like protein LSm8 n=1 Tax=Eurytemora carolleeae TaxID=1294199 RepID=UPI000C79543E|nr:U6 snRNA-associated Sm-like protein LSm8 [Eurytemora carolleeae]|eukprot:XP_023344805.1 U6 snRNA-associated Sm-like protein LSm8 [Eurytemora affinis]